MGRNYQTVSTPQQGLQVLEMLLMESPVQVGGLNAAADGS